LTAFVPGIGERDPDRIIMSLQQLAAGRSNGVGTVTLAAGVTTTTVNDPNVSALSVILLMQTTANAAAALATTYQSTTVNKQFILTHANNAQTDRTFRYAIQG
jgi:hypothetical protein